MRSDGNLVTVDLVVAASQMLFFSGGEPLRKTGLLAGADAPGFQLAPVLEKVSVHPPEEGCVRADWPGPAEARPKLRAARFPSSRRTPLHQGQARRGRFRRGGAGERFRHSPGCCGSSLD